MPQQAATYTLPCVQGGGGASGTVWAWAVAAVGWAPQGWAPFVSRARLRACHRNILYHLAEGVKVTEDERGGAGQGRPSGGGDLP